MITRCLNGDGVRAAVGTPVLIILFIMAAHAQAPSGLLGVVAPGAEPELVQEGFTFTEGPVGSPEACISPTSAQIGSTILIPTEG